jgi:hypothetical protein
MDIAHRGVAGRARVGKLDDELQQAAGRGPTLYEANALGYPYARTHGGAPRTAARQSLQPFLARGHFLRDLALHHLAHRRG